MRNHKLKILLLDSFFMRQRLKIIYHAMPYFLPFHRPKAHHLTLIGGGGGGRGGESPHTKGVGMLVGNFLIKRDDEHPHGVPPPRHLTCK